MRKLITKGIGNDDKFFPENFDHRFEDELRQSVEREAATMARLTAVEQELRSLNLLITSDESLQVFFS